MLSKEKKTERKKKEREGKVWEEKKKLMRVEVIDSLMIKKED